MMEVHRSQINEALYNPRVMAPDARRRLDKGIDKLGLLQPNVWNKRTGNLVGGHQRLKKMDKEHGDKDYKLTVAAVDLTEKQEKEANLLLNNAAAQGEFDMDKLEALLKTGLDVEATGWDNADVYRLFGDTTPVGTAEEAKAKVEEALQKLLDVQRATDEAKAQALARDNGDFYLVVVFKSHEERKAFTDARGLEDNRYQSGDSFLAGGEASADA